MQKKSLGTRLQNSWSTACYFQMAVFSKTSASYKSIRLGRGWAGVTAIVIRVFLKLVCRTSSKKIVWEAIQGTVCHSLRIPSLFYALTGRYRLG